MPLAIVQARCNSTRFPNKILANLHGVPVITFLLRRLKKSLLLSKIVLATTINNCDDCLEAIASSENIDIYRGSEHDVLGRFANVCRSFSYETIVRVTGDCPLVDPELIDHCLSQFESQNLVYLSSGTFYPDGFDIEVFTKSSLISADNKATDKFDREHVTAWISRLPPESVKVLESDNLYSKLRLSVDEPSDLTVVRKVVAASGKFDNITFSDIVNLLNSSPNLFEMNKNLIPNDGQHLSEGQKLWRRAKRVIPGGNMLLSKRPEMFLPDKWPSYFSKAKGCSVWDIQGDPYIDMSIMGIGPNILGYCNEEVDSVVHQTVSKGNMSTLNCPEEVYLAEKLVSIHPWADMVRFARSGGEANAIAIRIARAATGRDKVAICGYHGWHDWYLSTNLSTDDKLQEHLLPGLDPLGVPSVLAGTTLPFTFNKIDQVEELVRNNELAAIKMEVERHCPPAPGFLERIRELCDINGIVLIFDECTSGFRETGGGIHLKYNVQPDIAMFGKALGNGYAITAVVGREECMQAAQKTFISSTFWTERIGPTAALKTLEIMHRDKTWETITNTGQYIKDNWQKLADSYRISIEHFCIPSLAGYRFVHLNSQAYKTYIAQEMLKKGYLASTSCYSCIDHTAKVVDDYFTCLDPIFSEIAKFQENEIHPDSFLEGPICHSTFKRLN